FVVPRDNASPTRDALVSFLEERLPSYMVPRVFVFLNELPRNVSGKVERKLLVAPEMQRTEAEGSFVAPQTPIEEAVAQAFAMLLGVERVSMNDNIFDFGGNSLLIAQVVLYLSNVYGIDLPAVQLFKNPTAAGVVQVIEAYQSE